ncbi:MAG: DUF4838 domain-containing protein [Armatimonadia bacterium]
MIIARDGSTEFRIVRPAEAGLDFAADELARYLAIITGAWFEVAEEADGSAIVLRVEPGEAEEYGWEVEEGRVTLWGDCALSVLFAVYHLLESHAGCRWLSDFEGGEVVPRIEALEVPCERQVFRPAMTHRAFTNYPAIDQRTVSMVDWMAKHRFNRFMIFANAAGSLEAYEKVLRRELVGRGMKVEMGHHSFRFFLPPEEFFEKHPEWYAQLQGERSTKGQVCTSNPAVAEAMAARVCDFLDQHPEIDMVGLWPNDGYGWCECAECLSLEPQEPSGVYPSQPRRTDTYLKFVNAVAERVAQRHPDRFLSALAYVNYIEPPRETVPLANVKVCFAPFQRCFRHAIRGEEGCSRPNERYARLLEQWRGIVPGTLYLFEYLMLIDMMSLPYRLEPVLPADFQYYAGIGVDGFVLEFKPEEWGPYGENAHLIGRLAWDPEARLDEYRAGYYQELYGAAAGEMLEYFSILESSFIARGPCVYHYDLEYTRRATHQLLQPALEHLGRAIALAARGERRHREAVERAQTGVQLLERLGSWRELVAQDPARAREAGEELAQWVEARRKSGAVDAEYIARRVRTQP